MAATPYNPFKLRQLNGNAVNFATGALKVMLVTSGYTPNFDTHTFKSDVTNEVTGTGYTARGASVANKTVTQDSVNDRAIFDGDDTTWPSSTITARGAVLYLDTGVDSTSPIIAYYGFVDGGGSPADKSTNGDTFDISWATTGLLYI